MTWAKSALTTLIFSLALVGCGGGTTTYNNQVSVSGLAANEQVILQNNNANPITVSANQTVTFPASWQTSKAYAVTVASQTPGVTCATSSASGTMGTADVTVTVSCGAGTESVLYSFAGGAGDGIRPHNLVIDSNGNLYGTTYYGGVGYTGNLTGNGTVFKLVSNGVGGYSESVLYSFGTNGGTDGVNPLAGLIIDSSGNLYGTTMNGGTSGDGTIFKLTLNSNGNYSESVLWNFTGSNGLTGTGVTGDGAYPYAGHLIMDSNGNLYGTTKNGGTYGFGTVFKLTTDGTESVLHSFAGKDGLTGSGVTGDGANPVEELIIDNNNNLFGTTRYGGVNGNGSVFEITANGQESVLYSFGANSATDGANPYSSLIMDTSGNLYGTTQNGGNNNKGTVFMLTKSTGYTESVLYNFGTSSTTDGANPVAGLITDTSGNLYGTTYYGGIGYTGSDTGYGIVFKLTPNNNAGYTESVLYSFGTGTDGATPYASLITDTAGNLYGTTINGGTNNSGTVFKIN